MDNAVALVEAYLRVNGYFTVTEFPVVELLRRGGVRTVTDLDVLALRFPSARGVPSRDPADMEPDPLLGGDPARVDMLVGEVKGGHAELNRGASDPDVLRAMLMRFGCCAPASVTPVVQSLLMHGRAVTHCDHDLRLVAFGTMAEGSPHRPYHVVTMHHVVSYLRECLHANWRVLRHVQFRDPAFSFLLTIEKALHPGGPEDGDRRALGPHDASRNGP